MTRPIPPRIKSETHIPAFDPLEMNKKQNKSGVISSSVI